MVHVLGCRAPMQDINGPFLRSYAYSLLFSGLYQDGQASKTDLWSTQTGSAGNSGPHSTEPDWPAAEALPRLYSRPLKKTNL